MQLIHIPMERIRQLKKEPKTLARAARALRCKMRVEDGGVEIQGDPLAEFTARSVITAFGRGFDMDSALSLVDPELYFRSVDIGDVSPKSKRAKQIKARIIGERGRAKRYIEEVSGAKISIYGDTVSFIGDIQQISEAETAINTLIDGGSHKLAYIRMEALHRKNKASRSAAF